MPTDEASSGRGGKTRRRAPVASMARRAPLGSVLAVVVSCALEVPPASAPELATVQPDPVQQGAPRVVEAEPEVLDEVAETETVAGGAMGPAPPPTPIACGLQRGELILVDGGLRCRELPVEVAFPPQTTVRRSDNDYRTTFRAEREGASMTMVVERISARGVVCELDFCHFPAMDERALEAWLAGWMPAGSAPGRLRPPDLPGASLSLGLFYEGKSESVRAHGYVVDGWLVTLVGRDTAAGEVRPGGTVASGFLASLRPREVDHSKTVFELARRESRSDYGVALELPRSYWSADAFLQDSNGEGHWVLQLPSTGRQLELHVDTSTVCEASRDELVGQALLDNRRRRVRVRPRAKVPGGLYYETRVKRLTAEVWYSHCHEERVSVTLGLSDGVSTAEELEAELRTYVETLTFS